MRILDSDKNQIYNSIEIEMTQFELEEFYERLYDLTYNPGYKPNDVINNIIFSDSNENANIISTIEISVFSYLNLEYYNEKIRNFIKKDKI